MDRAYRKYIEVVRVWICLGAGLIALSAAQPPARIHTSLENGQTFELKGNTRPMLSQAQDLGEVDPALPLSRMTMHFALSAAQQADLNQLLEAQVNRKSSQYHQWLTPAQYAERFGMNSSDVQKVTSWLQGQGFTNVEVAQSRSFITFSGTADQVRSAFQTSLHKYMLNGESHYANSSDPLLPKALDGMVAGIRGLTDFHPKPHYRPAAVRPHFTSALTGNHYLSPKDWATIYDVQPLYGAGYTGTGQKIAVIGQSDINLSDIQNFRTAAGLPQNNPTIIVVGTDPGAQVGSGDQGESELDIEWAGGIAYNATVIFVNSVDVFNSSLYYAVDNNVAPVLSITYGNCESAEGSTNVATLNSLFQQAAAQGMTVLAASGDNGAADCDTGTRDYSIDGPAADFPGTSPYVTSVGGTTISEGTGNYWAAATGTTSAGDVISSALSYIPEVAWNDDSSGGLASSGGGASIYFSKPTWQSGTGVPADNARDVPDVAFAASPNHDGYLVCSSSAYCVNGTFRDATTNQSLDVVGGTSAATPSFAAVIALLNQKFGTSQGNINPTLYMLAGTSTNVYHDITSGNNIVACLSGSTGCPSGLQFGFSAGVGYDQVTGWGSVDAYHLVSQWLSDFSLSLSPTTLTLTPGTSASTTVTVAKSGNFAGTVSFTCTVSGIPNTTCSIPGTVTGSGTATLTVTAGANAATPAWPSFREFPDLRKPLLVTLAGLLVCCAAFLLAGKRKRPVVALAGALSILIVMASCGSGGSSSTTSTLSAATLSVSASPTTLSLSPGASGTSTATVTTGGSFSGNTALTVAGAPTGVTATLGTASLTGGSGSSVLTVAIGASAVPGTYPLTITATGDGVTSTATVNLTVAAQTGSLTVTATSGQLTSTATVALTLN